MGRPKTPWVAGKPCANCQTPMQTRDELYRGVGRLCRACGNATRNKQREAARQANAIPCRACGTPMTDGREKRFGRCGRCKAANAGQCACGQPVHIGVRCLACYRIERARYNARQRGSARNQCRCGADIGAQAAQCRKCHMAGVGGATALRQVVEPVARPVAQAWAGLRGPGGEWENGPTTVQGWATLDGGRV